MEITKNNPKAGINRSHRKENNFSNSYSLFAIVNGEIKKIAEVRIYITTTRFYSCFWVWAENSAWQNGSGWASGSGYCKESTATAEAMGAAGIEFSANWGGGGTENIEKALILLGQNLGYKALQVFKNHG